jgi:hypothetical protein
MISQATHDGGGYHGGQPQEEWMNPGGKRSEVSAQIREINDMLSLSACIGRCRLVQNETPKLNGVVIFRGGRGERKAVLNPWKWNFGDPVRQFISQHAADDFLFPPTNRIRCNAYAFITNYLVFMYVVALCFE